MCCLRVKWIQLNIKNYFEGPPLGYYHFIFTRYRTSLLPQLQCWHHNFLRWRVSANSVGDAHSQVRCYTGCLRETLLQPSKYSVLLTLAKDQSITNVQCVSGVRRASPCSYVTNNSEKSVGCTACSLVLCHPVCAELRWL